MVSHVDWGRFEVGPTGLSPEDLKAWRPIRSRIVFEHRNHSTLVEEIVELPDGSHQTWIRYADHRDGVPEVNAAGGICQRHDGKILVSWQWNLGPQQIVAEFPGGGIEPGETPEQAVRRELTEEVCLRPRTVRRLGRYFMTDRRAGRTSTWFLCTDLEPAEAVGDEAGIATAWLTPEQIDEQIRAERFENKSMLAAWAMFRAHTNGA